MTLTAEQQTLRAQGIGASEISAVCGVDPYRNALDIYLAKVGLAPPFEGNEFTHFGQKLEPVIADEYAERMGLSIRESDTLVHPEHDWVLCTPDRIVTGPDGAEWGLECKNRNYFNYKAWGEPGTDEVPLEVSAQVHWSLFVTGMKRWDCAVLLGGNRLAVYTLEYDEEVANQLFETGRDFWFNFVIPRITPPLDGSDSATQYMNRKWPLYGADMREATPEIAELAEELRLTREVLKGSGAEKERLNNLIKDFIGDQMGVVFPNGKITWKRPKSTIKTNWKMVADGLKSKVTPEVYETLVNMHTEERVNARRFLCTFAEKDS